MTETKNSTTTKPRTYLQLNSFLEFDNLVGAIDYEKVMANIEDINKPLYYPK